jgi:maltooligosyltrehalose synthase
MNNMNDPSPGKRETNDAAPALSKVAMPPVETEGLRQTRDSCTKPKEKLRAYFEKGVRETKHMDSGTRNHLGYCSECSDFFDMLIDPDSKK